MRKILFILCSMSLLSSSAFAASQCADIFATFKNSISALAEFRLDLDLKKAQGQSSVELSVLANDYAKKEKELVMYLESNKIMTETELISRVKSKIAELQKNKTQNAEDPRRLKEALVKIQNSVIDGGAVFHRIEPGTMKSIDPVRRLETTLTKPYEMMATPTTQIIWRTVVELAEMRFGKIRTNSPPDPSGFKGDLLPVENVTYRQVLVWLKSLNELSAAGEPHLASIIAGHKNGDTYRLPTSAEWLFVLRGRGLYNDTYHFGNDPQMLDQYAWHQGNSGSKTHPVATRLPVVIGTMKFYDMLGNVAEWTADAFSTLGERAGIDPYDPGTATSKRITHGGSWNLDYYHHRSWDFMTYQPTDFAPYIGFRFVREVKP